MEFILDLDNLTVVIGLITGFEIAAIIAVVLTVINIGISIFRMMTAPGPPDPPVPKPNAIDSIPAAEQGKAVPVIFGTRIVSQPNCVFWGNPRNEPIKKSQDEIAANS